LVNARRNLRWGLAASPWLTLRDCAATISAFEESLMSHDVIAREAPGGAEGRASSPGAAG